MEFSTEKKKIDPENLELQLAELEMLTAMFPSEEELSLDNPAIVGEINEWLEKEQFKDFLEPPPCISFKLSLRCEPGPKILDICFRFPLNYPGSEPLELSGRSEGLTRAEQTDFNTQLNSKIQADFVPGDLMCGALIAWLQENGPSFFHEVKPKKTGKPGRRQSQVTEFVRLWIVSHHIYSMTKRKDILDICRDLTGFSMPGKPGIICLEGKAEECNAAWATIKAMTWKKIALKYQEVSDSRKTTESEWRKFPQFEEIGFVKNSTESSSSSYHMDMGGFHDYLKEHFCQNIFKLLFHIE